MKEGKNGMKNNEDSGEGEERRKSKHEKKIEGKKITIPLFSFSFFHLPLLIFFDLIFHFFRPSQSSTWARKQDDSEKAKGVPRLNSSPRRRVLVMGPSSGQEILGVEVVVAAYR